MKEIVRLVHDSNKADRPDAPPRGVVKVGLLQINNSFSGQNYLPYSVACLRAYVERNAARPDRYDFLPMVYKRSPIREIVANLSDADVVGFSVYVWNVRMSLEAARRLKSQRPETLIVFGGPQVPDKPEAFLRENPFIDLVVHNEGEKVFLNILENFPRNDWEEIKGISYLDGDAFVATPAETRMKDLSELPSPFLNDIFQQIMEENPDEKWIGLWETNRGCPFQCTFCDWGSATAAKVHRFEMDRLERELDWFVGNQIEYIFVCDANFGSLKRDIDIAERVSQLRGKTGYPQGFSVQSTKNATDRAYVTQKILSDAGLNKGVALSMQSLDPTVLENIKRDNISLETYFELSRRFSQDNVETYSDLILGLPGETFDSFLAGVDKLILAGQHNRIQFNNLSILPNAEMGDPDYLEKFGMKTVRSEIINIHGSREYIDDDVPEIQEVVVETYSLTREEWRRTRAISWMISFLYFDKLAQIPILLLHEVGGIGYGDIFKYFLNVEKRQFPLLAWIRDYFLECARIIQEGGAEYSFSKEWLGIYWPADEYVFISLTADGKMDDFYSEVEGVISKLVNERNLGGNDGAIQAAIAVNRLLVSQPNQPRDVAVTLDYNVIEFWRGVCAGLDVPLVAGKHRYSIMRSERHYSEFQKWCQEVVWWGNKKGAYLYALKDLSETEGSMDVRPAGHY